MYTVYCVAVFKELTYLRTILPLQLLTKIKIIISCLKTNMFDEILKKLFGPIMYFFSIIIMLNVFISILYIVASFGLCLGIISVVKDFVNVSRH